MASDAIVTHGRSARLLCPVVLALLILVLSFIGCRPAWDPSGRYIAFTYAVDIDATLVVRGETGGWISDGHTDLFEPAKCRALRGGVAVCDVETGTIRRLYESDGYVLWKGYCFWVSNGASVVVVAPNADMTVVGVIRIDPRTGVGETVAEITGLAPVSDLLAAPVVVRDRYMWVGPLIKAKNAPRGNEVGPRSNDRVAYFHAQVDLGTGKVVEHYDPRASLAFMCNSSGDKCFYVRTVIEGLPKRKRVYEICLVDGLDGTRGEVLRRFDDLDEAYWEFMAPDAAGERLAVTIERKELSELLVLDILGQTFSTTLLESGPYYAGITWNGDSVWIAGLNYNLVNLVLSEGTFHANLPPSVEVISMKSRGPEPDELYLSRVDTAKVQQDISNRIHLGHAPAHFLAASNSANGRAICQSLWASLSPKGARMAVSASWLSPMSTFGLVIIDPADPKAEPRRIALPMNMDKR